MSETARVYVPIKRKLLVCVKAALLAAVATIIIYFFFCIALIIQDPTDESFNYLFHDAEVKDLLIILFIFCGSLLFWLPGILFLGLPLWIFLDKKIQVKKVHFFAAGFFLPTLFYTFLGTQLELHLPHIDASFLVIFLAIGGVGILTSRYIWRLTYGRAQYI